MRDRESFESDMSPDLLTGRVCVLITLNNWKVMGPAQSANGFAIEQGGEI